MAKKRQRIEPAKQPAAQPSIAKARSGKIRKLIHELQVHAEEITVQNEQLITVQHELEEARDRFADLYDFAPIGYLSVDDHGVIVEINLAGATLLDRARSFLLNVPLSAVMTTADRQAVDDFLARARARASAGVVVGGRGHAAQTLEATTRTDRRRTLRFIARPDLVGANAQLFVAMVDVTEERRLEEQRGEALSRERGLAEDRAREVVERRLAEARIKALLERLVTAQEEERRRIARNLHDHLGQQLTALRLALDAIANDRSASEGLRSQIAAAETIVSKIDRDVDLLAWDLRPAALDDMGLGAALSDLLQQWTAVTRVAAEFHQPAASDLRLPAEIESNIYRIVQEALNNVAKHAGATHVSLLIERRGDEAAVIIEDNGRGFDPDKVLASRERAAMMGLLGMRERAALIDGEVQIESQPGQGTTVFVRIPIKQRSG